MLITTLAANGYVPSFCDDAGWRVESSPARGTGSPVNSVYLRVLGAVLRRPGLIGGLVSTAWAFRARDWYRRAPFLPVPPRGYVRWRMETAYGDSGAVPPPGELEAFVRWGVEMRKRM